MGWSLTGRSESPWAGLEAYNSWAPTSCLSPASWSARMSEILAVFLVMIAACASPPTVCTCTCPPASDYCHAVTPSEQTSFVKLSVRHFVTALRKTSPSHTILDRTNFHVYTWGRVRTHACTHTCIYAHTESLLTLCICYLLLFAMFGDEKDSAV